MIKVNFGEVSLRGPESLLLAEFVCVSKSVCQMLAEKYSTKEVERRMNELWAMVLTPDEEIDRQVEELKNEMGDAAVDVMHELFEKLRETMGEEK